MVDVVGVLKSEFGLLRKDYLIPASEKANALFPDGEPSVHPATLVPLAPAQFHNRNFLQELLKPLSPPKYTIITPAERLEPATFYFSGSRSVFLFSSFIFCVLRWMI